MAGRALLGGEVAKRHGLESAAMERCVDHREALLCELRAIRKPQLVDFTLCASGPRAWMAKDGA
jgi:hypothetical protein